MRSIDDGSAPTRQVAYGLAIFAASVACGYAVFYAYYVSRLNRGFIGKTDIIGYPAFYNYNNNALFYGYVLGLLAAVSTLLILVRYVGPQRLEGFLPRLPPIVLASPIIAFALVLKSSGTWYGWAVIAAVTLGLLRITACGVGVLLQKGGKSASAEGAFSVALAATIPLLLFYISQNTGWRGDQSTIVVHIRWFPAPVLIVIELLVAAWGIHCLRSEDGARLFDKYFVRLLLIPALIYCLMANLPSDQLARGWLFYPRGLDDFHGGERLAPLVLALRGAMPWRDFLFIHGIWDDFLQLYLPARWWEATPRTGWAGTPLLFAPIYWICFYLFFLVVFEFSLLPVLTAFFLLISLIFPDPFRFILYPLILLCLYRILCSKRSLPWVLFIVLCGVQVVLAPEFALLALCFGFVVILRDLLERDNKRPWTGEFRPTLICGASTMVFIVLVGWWLSAHEFLEGFLIATLQIARGHLQTGSIPVQTLPSLLWVTGIPLLFVVGAVFVFVQALLHSRKQVPALVWLLLGLALCTVIYYPKYIGRPDGHIGEVIAVAQPGIVLLVVLLLGQARQSLLAHYRPWVPAAVANVFLGLVVLYGFPGNPFQPLRWLDYIVDSAGSFRNRFISANQSTDFAELNTDTTTAAKAADLRRFFDAHLRPEDTVFDFSDSPTTSFVILQLKPASRFIHVSMAIQEELQRQVVRDLERSRPPYVIYRSDGGLNGWDGIANEVRHYVIARYINLNYVYDRTIDGSVIFRRADLLGQLPDDGGELNLGVCDLGFLPNAFSPRMPLHDRENALAPDPVITHFLQLDGWAALSAGSGPPEITVRWNGAVLDHFQPSMVRPDVDKALGRSLGETGFSRQIVLPDPTISAKDIDISGGSTPTGKSLRFNQGPLRGFVDSSTVMQAISLLPPRAGRPAYLGLQFAGDPTGIPQPFFIALPQSSSTRITFTKISRDDELILPLGGCYAWGAISKSTPQVGSSKPFTLKSAFYYYE